MYPIREKFPYKPAEHKTENRLDTCLSVIYFLALVILFVAAVWILST